MTEKERFIFCNKSTDSNVWDTQEKQCYGWEFVVHLLNEQHEQITTLEHLLQEISYYFEENKSLKDLDNKDFRALQRLCKGLVD